jgi:hypothetical protein
VDIYRIKHSPSGLFIEFIFFLGRNCYVLSTLYSSIITSYCSISHVGNCSVINSTLFPIYMNVYDPTSYKISNSWLLGSTSFCHCHIERKKWKCVYNDHILYHTIKYRNKSKLIFYNPNFFPNYKYNYLPCYSWLGNYKELQVKLTSPTSYRSPVPVLHVMCC